MTRPNQVMKVEGSIDPDDIQDIFEEQVFPKSNPNPDILDYSIAYPDFWTRIQRPSIGIESAYTIREKVQFPIGLGLRATPWPTDLAYDWDFNEDVTPVQIVECEDNSSTEGIECNKPTPKYDTEDDTEEDGDVPYDLAIFQPLPIQPYLTFPPGLRRPPGLSASSSLRSSYGVSEDLYAAYTGFEFISESSSTFLQPRDHFHPYPATVYDHITKHIIASHSHSHSHSHRYYQQPYTGDDYCPGFVLAKRTAQFSSHVVPLPRRVLELAQYVEERRGMGYMVRRQLYEDRIRNREATSLSRIWNQRLVEEESQQNGQDTESCGEDDQQEPEDAEESRVSKPGYGRDEYESNWSYSSEDVPCSMWCGDVCCNGAHCYEYYLRTSGNGEGENREDYDFEMNDGHAGIDNSDRVSTELTDGELECYEPFLDKSSSDSGEESEETARNHQTIDEAIGGVSEGATDEAVDDAIDALVDKMIARVYEVQEHLSDYLTNHGENFEQIFLRDEELKDQSPSEEIDYDWNTSSTLRSKRLEYAVRFEDHFYDAIEFPESTDNEEEEYEMEILMCTYEVAPTRWIMRMGRSWSI